MQFTLKPLDAVTVLRTERGWCRGDPSARHQLITGGLRIVAIAISGLQQRFNIPFADQIAQRLFSSSLLSLLPASSMATASATGR